VLRGRRAPFTKWFPYSNACRMGFASPGPGRFSRISLIGSHTARSATLGVFTPWRTPSPNGTAVERQATDSPSPGGEGWGEGELSFQLAKKFHGDNQRVRLNFGAWCLEFLWSLVFGVSSWLWHSPFMPHRPPRKKKSQSKPGVLEDRQLRATQLAHQRHQAMSTHSTLSRLRNRKSDLK